MIRSDLSRLCDGARRGLVLAAMGLLFASPTLAGPRPLVEAELRIDSGLFSTGLGAGKGVVEERVAAWLAAELEKTLSYVDWVGRAPDRPRPPYGLVARLVDQAGTGCGTRVDLVFAIRVPGSEAELAQEWKLKLDDECNLDIPTRDAPRLVDLLQEKLLTRLADPAFRETLEAQLLRGVTLAKEVRLRDQSIAVPFSPAELHAAVDTRFFVEFSTRVDQSPRSGDMEMLLRRAAAWGSVCLVTQLHFGNISLPDPVEWHPSFAQIFDPARGLEVTVRMRKYLQTLNPSGPVPDAPLTEP